MKRTATTARPRHSRQAAAFCGRNGPTPRPNADHTPGRGPSRNGAVFEITSAKGGGGRLLAPKGTPAPIMARLSETLQKVLQQKEVHEALQRANSIPAWQTPEEFRQGIAADRAMYSELLPAIGIRGN